MHTALLVIDVQQALCSGEYRAFESERVIERINTVARKMRRVGAPVIMIQHESVGEHSNSGLMDGSWQKALRYYLPTS